MLLYVFLSITSLFLVSLGLSQESVEVALAWPNEPGDRLIALNSRLTNGLSILFAVALWALTAFRSASIGNDTQQYLLYFDVFASEGIDSSRSFELGYQLLNVVISKFTTDPHVFLIIMATIMYYGTFHFIMRYSRNIPASTCLFFCVLFSFFASVLRQGLALVIALYGYQRLKEHKQIVAALLFALAASFHLSAIVCFLLFFHPRWLNSTAVLFTIIFLSLGLSMTGLLGRIVNSIAPRYAHYFSSRYASTGWLSVTYSLVKGILLYLYIRPITQQDSESGGIIISNFALLILFATFGYTVNLFTRASHYFDAIAIIEFPNIVLTSGKNSSRLAVFLLCIFELIMFIIILIFRPGWNHLYPYEFWS